jgi:hypothetical protein
VGAGDLTHAVTRAGGGGSYGVGPHGVEKALSAEGPEDLEELRWSTLAAWRSEKDAERLRARAVRVCEEELARAQRMLERVRASEDKEELREVGLEVAQMADKDTLCSMAVHAAAQDGVNVNTLAAAGEMRWLEAAASAGLVETVRALVEAGAEVDHADTNGRTALWSAALNGQAEATLALLVAGAEVDHADKNEWTALIAAAHNGHAHAVQALVESGADLDHANNYGETALRAAVQYKWRSTGRVEAILVLLEAGADPDRADVDGLTPLAAAQAKNYEEAVLALVAQTSPSPLAAALPSLKVPELRETAKARGIKAPSKLKKQELIDAITAASM